MINSDETSQGASEEISASLAIVQDPQTVSAEAHQRANLAIHHLLGAAEAAKRAHKIDEDNKANELGDWFSSLMHDVSVAIILSFAALEAHVNELITDIIDANQSNTTVQRRELLESLRDNIRNGTEDKYIQLGLYYDKSVDKGCSAWEDIKLLSQIRNSLVHFRPAWDNDKIHSKNWVKNAKQRFSVCRFYDSDDVKAKFPYIFFTYECAKWSVEIVRAFIRYYCSLLGLQDRFADPHWNFTLP